MDHLNSGPSPALLGTYRDADPLGLRIRQAAVRMFRDSLDQALDRVDRSLRDELKRAQQAIRVAPAGADQARLEHLRSLLGAGRREAMLLLDNLLGEHADPTAWPDESAGGERAAGRAPAEMPGAAWSPVQGAALSAMDVVSLGLTDTLGITVGRMHQDSLATFTTAWESFGRDQERRGRMSQRGGVAGPRAENRAARHPFDVVFFARVIYLAHAAVGLITRNGADPYHVAVMTHLTDTVGRALGASLRESIVLLADAGFGVRPAAGGSANASAHGNGSGGTAETPPENTRAGDRTPIASTVKPTSDTELFGSLCTLLSAWEPTAEEVAQVTRMAEEGVHIPMPALTKAETTSVIAVLQTMVPPGLAEALGLGRGRIAAEIKAAMKEQAVKQGFDGDLDQHDSLSVDLVDEAVDTSLVDRRLQNAARAIMARILFPSVKAAMKDQEGFSSQNNPARDFIGVLAEAVAPKDSTPRKEVLDKASEMVDNLVANFHEDLSIFTELTQEIRQHLEKAKRDAAGERGERRAAWRTRLQQRWSNSSVAAPVRSFAIFLGAEHLSRQEDRGAGGGIQERDTLHALDALIRATSSSRQRVRIDGVWRQRLLDMLDSCGWHGVRAHSLLAEQEDLIHAFHVLGRTDFQGDPVEQRLSNPQEDDLKKTAETNRSSGAANNRSGHEGPRPGQKISVDSARTETGNPMSAPGDSMNAPAAANHGRNIRWEDTPRAAPTGGADGSESMARRAHQQDVHQPVVHQPSASNHTLGHTTDPGAPTYGRARHEENTSAGASIQASAVRQVAYQETAAERRSSRPASVPVERTVNETPGKPNTDRNWDGPKSANAPVGPMDRTNVVPLRRPEEPQEEEQKIRAEAAEPSVLAATNAPTDRELLEQISNLPLNSWSTFVVSPGHSARVRLSWVSPLSMKYLFVNSHGIRALMGTPNELLLLARTGRFFPGADVAV